MEVLNLKVILQVVLASQLRQLTSDSIQYSVLCHILVLNFNVCVSLCVWGGGGGGLIIIVKDIVLSK